MRGIETSWIIQHKIAHFFWLGHFFEISYTRKRVWVSATKHWYSVSGFGSDLSSVPFLLHRGIRLFQSSWFGIRELQSKKSLHSSRISLGPVSDMFRLLFFHEMFSLRSPPSRSSASHLLCLIDKSDTFCQSKVAEWNLHCNFLKLHFTKSVLVIAATNKLTRLLVLLTMYIWLWIYSKRFHHKKGLLAAVLSTEISELFWSVEPLSNLFFCLFG